MRVLLDIKDKKALTLLKVLNDLSYVKTTIISKEKGKLIEEIKEAIDCIHLVKEGKVQARPINDLLNEL